MSFDLFACIFLKFHFFNNKSHLKNMIFFFELQILSSFCLSVYVCLFVSFFIHRFHLFVTFSLPHHYCLTLSLTYRQLCDEINLRSLLHVMIIHLFCFIYQKFFLMKIIFFCFILTIFIWWCYVIYGQRM